MNFTRLVVLVFACMIIHESARAAQPATQSALIVTLTPAVEDGHKIIHALATLDSKVVKDLKIQFRVKRTFGLLPLGEDTTDDQGTAAVPFPEGLPGDEKGTLQVVATIVSPGPDSGVSFIEPIPGGEPVVLPTAPAFPRALWGARSPTYLYVIVIVLLGSVWLTYARVVGLILSIRKGD